MYQAFKLSRALIVTATSSVTFLELKHYLKVDVLGAPSPGHKTLVEQRSRRLELSEVLCSFNTQWSS